MSIKITRDGQMVERVGGDARVGQTGKTVRVGYSTVEHAKTVLADHEVDPVWLEAIKAGDGPPGVEYIDDDAEALEGDDQAVFDQAQYDRAVERIAELEQELKKEKQLSQDLQSLLDDANQRLSSESSPESKDASVDAPPADGGSGQSVDFSGQPQYQDDPDYDPNQRVQADVLDYLKSASPAEVERVKALEASKQDRQQIAAFQAAEG